MKNLILIPILFIFYCAQAQYIVVKPSQLPPASTINPSDLFIINQGTTTKKVTSSVLNTVLKDTFATRTELGDTARAIRDDFPTGSTITASDGVYMDGDTIKLSNSVIKRNSFEIIVTKDDSYDGSYIDMRDRSFIEIGSQYSSNGRFATVTSYSNEDFFPGDYPKVVLQTTGNTIATNVTLIQDTTGIHYDNIKSPDTTLTTPTHLMTEAQTKREIAAAQKWQNISGGISYGNEVTIGSLSGTGTRNIGADANGKLVELAATGGDVMKASVTLTSPQIYNNTWVQILPAQASGKMAFVTGIILYYNYVSVAYSAGEPSLKISYDGSTEAHDFQDSTIPAFLDGTSDKVYYWPVGSNYSVITTNGALYVRNGTPVGEPYGDGTLTVTITYVVIDI